MSTQPCRWRTAWAVRDLRWHSAVALSISHDWITWARSISLLWIPLFPMLCRGESEYPSLSAPDLPTDYDATLQFPNCQPISQWRGSWILLHVHTTIVVEEISLCRICCNCQSCRIFLNFIWLYKLLLFDFLLILYPRVSSCYVFFSYFQPTYIFLKLENIAQVQTKCERIFYQ